MPIRSFRPTQYAEKMKVYPKTVYNWIKNDQMPEGVNVIKFPSGVYRIDVRTDLHPPFPADFEEDDIG